MSEIWDGPGDDWYPGDDDDDGITTDDFDNWPTGREFPS
jgi:hypothetical protein